MVRNKYIVLLFFLLLFLPFVALGQTDMHKQINQWVKPLSETFLQKKIGSTITIPASETVQDNYVLAADSITIEGNIDGDIIVGAFDLTVNGDVSGDVIAVAETIEINGDIAGNIRVAAEEVTINGAVGKNATLFVGSATFTNKATVGWSLAFWAGEISIQAPIGGSVYGYGGDIIINNTVGTNVTLIFDEQGHATLETNAEIKGNLNYRSDTAVTVESGAQIHGDTTHKFTPAEILKKRELLSSAWIFTKIISLFGILLVGTILVSLFEKTSRKIVSAVTKTSPVKIAWGLLLLFGTPIALVLLAITIIGVPLTIIGIGCYFLLLYLSQIFLGLAIGSLILRTPKEKDKKDISIIWKMMLGVFIYILLINIPYIGWFIGLIGTIWYLGSVWQYIVQQLAARKKPQPAETKSKQDKPNTNK